MDYATQIQMMVRSLKGAPLSVFVLMVWSRQVHPVVWSVDELKAGTGYKHGTAIADARATLINLGLCEAADRGRIGLRLVDRAVQQLGLWAFLPPVGDLLEGGSAESDIRKTNLTPGSSSGYIAEDAPLLLESQASAPAPASLNNPLLLRQSEIRKTNLTPPAPPPHPALEQLVELLGGPRKRARQAIQAALDRGDHPVWIESEIAWWSLYVNSPKGQAIRGGPLFVAAKIEQDEQCPAFLAGIPRTNMTWASWRDYNQAAIRHAEALDEKWARIKDHDGQTDPHDLPTPDEEEADDPTNE